MQNEITEKSALLGKDGKLAHRGYSKRMVLDYDRNAVAAHNLRIKEWDYYIVKNDDFAVALTVADNSYMGLVCTSLIDFRVPWEQTTSIMTFMPKGKTGMPASSKEGDVFFKHDKCEYAFTLEDGGRRRLVCSMKDLKDGKPFSCEIVLSDEPEESIVMATPYKEDDRAFYYNQKINCMRAEGRAIFDGKTYEFTPDNSFGTLDWGRGVWTYKNVWYWGSGSGLANGERIGFNIGYGFGDTSAASENALFYEGKTHKLEDVCFNIPMKNGKEDYMAPWTFTSSDGRFECDFVPVLDRASCTDALLIKSDQHQVFGKYSGRLTLDDGRVVEIRDLLGFAEKVINRW